jgi:hypothetical protein
MALDGRPEEGGGALGPTTPGLTPSDLHAALRRITIGKAGQAVVLLCGAAYKNKVRPLTQHP